MAKTKYPSTKTKVKPWLAGRVQSQPVDPATFVPTSNYSLIGMDVDKDELNKLRSDVVATQKATKAAEDKRKAEEEKTATEQRRLEEFKAIAASDPNTMKSSEELSRYLRAKQFMENYNRQITANEQAYARQKKAEAYRASMGDMVVAPAQPEFQPTAPAPSPQPTQQQQSKDMASTYFKQFKPPAPTAPTAFNPVKAQTVAKPTFNPSVKQPATAATFAPKKVYNPYQ